MNASFDPLHLVNTYGAFGSVTRRRNEVVVEGTADEPQSPDADWREYEFKGKPTDLRRVPRPGRAVPPPPRLADVVRGDLAAATPRSWFVPFLLRLLENDRPTLGLLRRNPFPDCAAALRPGAALPLPLLDVAASCARPRSWWVRQLVGEYVPAIGLDAFARGRTRDAA